MKRPDRETAGYSFVIYEWEQKLGSFRIRLQTITAGTSEARSDRS
jgi:hypothetical protein